MIRLLAVTIIIVACQPCIASDWKYAGYLDGIRTGPTVAFLDEESITRDGAKVRYWTKMVPQKTLESFAGPPGKPKYRAFIEEAAIKVASGYVPPMLTGSSLRRVYRSQMSDPEGFVAEVVAWEIAANRGARHTSLFLFEIDCAKQATRYVQGTLFDKSGNPKKTFGERKWEFIAPDTNSAWVSEVLCARQAQQ